MRNPTGAGFFFANLMRYSSLIDNVTASEWQLSIAEAYLFSWLYTIPTWANRITIDGFDFYKASRHLVSKELPLMSEKPDTIYRYYKSLSDKGLILIKKVDNSDYIHLTDLAKKWGSKQDRQSEGSEKNPSDSEKNPSELGKFSDDSLLSNNKEKVIKKTDADSALIALVDEFEMPEFTDAWGSFIRHRKQLKKPITAEQGPKLLKKLFKDVGGDLDLALIWIENAIARGWQGVYPPESFKNNNHNHGGITEKQQQQRVGFARRQERYKEMDGNP